jgi:hypothetical protein
MQKFEGIFFPGETLESDLEDRILKKVLFYFDKTYVIIPELFNFRLDDTLREYTHRYQPEKLDEFSRDLAIVKHTYVTDRKVGGKEVDKSAFEWHERIIKLLGETESLRQEGLLEIINPEENIKSIPYYWDEDAQPAEKFFSIKEKFQNLSAAEINFSNITNYTPHLLFGNILEDLRDKEFRNIVKENFTFDTVTMYKGQAETNWFETLSGGEDIIELVPSDYFEFGFCSHISSTMWASLLINHTLISSLRKKAVPTCSHPTMQRLLNRKMSRLYEKLVAVDTGTPHVAKDVSPFNLVLENLPNFEFKSFEDIIETREKLKDELSEFRQKMCAFTGIIKAEPYRKICKDHLDLLQMDNMQQALDNLRKKISSLNRKTIPKVVATKPLNLLLHVTPSLPPALALLGGSDVFSPTTILNTCEKDFKDLPEKNGLSYVITIGNA